MKTKTTLPQLAKDDIKVGRCYSAKKPKRVILEFSELYDDKQVLYISPNKSHKEIVHIEYAPEFQEWVKKEIYHSLTSEYSQMCFESEHPDKVARILTVEWDYNVQYDSPSVKNGKNYPMMPMKKFLAWVGKDVTELMPKGDWREWERNNLRQKELVK